MTKQSKTMTVKFKCEKCGEILGVWSAQTQDSLRRWFSGENGSCGLYHKCPHDSVSFGPLTEEMIGEALQVAYFEDGRAFLPVSDDWILAARFVLRLLGDPTVNDINPSCTGKWDTERYRQIVMSLAGMG